MTNIKLQHIIFILALFGLQPISCKKNINTTTLAPEQLETIGKKIWRNESNCSVEKLTWWHELEAFPSFGIGHFIWYPKDVQAPFTQTFPALLAFMQSKGQELPTWLASKEDQTYCPWCTRQEFYQHIHDEQLKQLRTLLTNTVPVQIAFIIDRMQQALPNMLATVAPSQHKHIKQQFNRMTQTPAGMYALIDYVHFKGEGTNIKERYDNSGWGLLQVLEQMQGKKNDDTALIEFTDAAKNLLTQRVQHAPNKDNEAKLLPGWINRVNSYTQPL